ncbi:MAG: hypothetical protein RL026_2636 [Pseudomonadota bacterium]|jgi:DNA polymerase-3 subunit delta'
MDLTLPWLEASLRGLQAAATAGRLPQALLIHEWPGAGGMQLARKFAQLVLCEAGSDRPCGRCGQCRRVASGEHPDVLHVAPSPDAKLPQIGVDDIRDACAQCVMTSYEGRGSVAVVHPADTMNHHAANALLKTLEEPRSGLHIVLVTARPSGLPATILSRCQKLPLPMPDRDVLLQWLQQQRPSPDWAAALDATGGAVLEAASLDPGTLRRLRDETWTALQEAVQGRLDVVRTADHWARGDLIRHLHCTEAWLVAQVTELAGISPATGEMRSAPGLRNAIPGLNMGRLLRLLERVQQLRHMAGTTLNKSLLVEQLLWRLSTASNPGRQS